MNLSRRIILICLFLMAPWLLPAHEFWLQPEKFICHRGETINIRFQVGEHFNGHNWTGNATRIKSLKFYMGSIKDDLSANLSKDKGDSLQLAMFDEGTGMITFQSTNAYIKLEAKKFNDYLRGDALKDAIAYRMQNDEMDEAGKEQYQRSVKTLFQVGSKMNDCYKLSTGLPIDMILQSNPYSVRNNQLVTVKILFRNKPLINQCIKLWHRLKRGTILKDLMTNSKGEIKFRLQKTGKWMISTVTMVRLENNEPADWQSYWGSLTWGYLR